jgi:hypothetical protein
MRSFLSILGCLLLLLEPNQKDHPDSCRSLFLFGAKRLELLGFGLIFSLLSVRSMFVSIDNAKGAEERTSSGSTVTEPIEQQPRKYSTKAEIGFEPFSNKDEHVTLTTTTASAPVFLSHCADNRETTESMNAECKLRRSVRIRSGVHVVRRQILGPSDMQLQTEWSENTLDGIAGEFDPLDPQSDDESEPMWVPSMEEQAKAALRHGFQVKNHDDGCNMDEEELLAAMSAKRRHDTAAKKGHRVQTTSVGFLHISKLSQVANRLQEEQGSSPRCLGRGAQKVPS